MTTTTRRSLRQPIVNAPIAGHPPRLNTVVRALDPESLVQGLIPVFGDLSPRRLNRAQLVRAARHEHILFSVPVPVEAEPGMRHWIGWRPKLGVLPALAAVGGYLNPANSAPT